jgi:hypothetical protein
VGEEVVEAARLEPQDPLVIAHERIDGANDDTF